MIKNKENLYLQFDEVKKCEEICINCKFFHPSSLKSLEQTEAVLDEHHCLYPENYKEIIRENYKGDEIKFLVKIEKVFRSHTCDNFKPNITNDSN